MDPTAVSRFELERGQQLLQVSLGHYVAVARLLAVRLVQAV